MRRDLFFGRAFLTIRPKPRRAARFFIRCIWKQRN